MLGVCRVRLGKYLPCTGAGACRASEHRPAAVGPGAAVLEMVTRRDLFEQLALTRGLRVTPRGENSLARLGILANRPKLGNNLLLRCGSKGHTQDRSTLIAEKLEHRDRLFGDLIASAKRFNDDIGHCIAFRALALHGLLRVGHCQSSWRQSYAARSPGTAWCVGGTVCAIAAGIANAADACERKTPVMRAPRQSTKPLRTAQWREPDLTPHSESAMPSASDKAPDFENLSTPF